MSPWVLQSLFLAAIGEARERGAKAVEAFAYRYGEGESVYERFHVHKTIFPADFLGDFGFRVVRSRRPRRPCAAGARRTRAGRRRRCARGLCGPREERLDAGAASCLPAAAVARGR